ncbi:kallikrein-11-like [Pieris napi]|uniref:kallikrein-11-like n=1 Tax=Pieris napi TaxID=78633 RepID=UPI001FBA207D|nr:kallikrein-11-like [Pieris napi]
METLLQLSLVILILCHSVLTETKIKRFPRNVPSRFESLDICNYEIPSKINFHSNHHSISIRKCGEYVAEVDLRERQREFNKKCKNQWTVESTPEYSHMAAVGLKTGRGSFKLQCAGALISPNFVLTAFTCYMHPNKNLKVSPNIVRLGTPNIKKQHQTAVNIGIKHIIKHPMQKDIYNDLALVELSNAVKFSKYIQPVCLSTVAEISHRPISVTGWNFRSSKNIYKPFNSTLQSASISKFDKNCFAKETKTNFNQKMFCSDNINIDGIASCPSKCGSTLQINLNVSKNEGALYKLLAIIPPQNNKNSADTCKSNEVVYIEIKPYLNWIEQNVWP